MRAFIIIYFFLGAFSAMGQFGMRSSYNLNNASEWNDYFSVVDINGKKVFDRSLSYSLDYWIRLPQKRVEFYPFISYHTASSSLSTRPVDLSFRQVGFGINSHIYFLDFIGDCDCPTFSKQGGLFKKGLFLLAGIGADYSQKQIDDKALINNNVSYEDGNLDFKIAIGIGFDIGVNDFLTVSPILQYQYYPDISWHELPTRLGLTGENNINSALGQLQLGVRLGIRLDYE